MNKKKKFILKVIVIALPFLLVDVVSKYYAILNMALSKCVVFDSLCFRYSENTGIAFSIPIPMIVILTVNTFLLAILLKLAVDELKLNNITLLAISLMLAGGIGNLVDRFTRGYVVDFISISKFPIFNIADMYISLAVLIIIAFYAKIKR